MRISILLISLLMVSCSVIEPIKPWERDVLARDNMQLNDDKLVQQIDEQIYYSKEASHGGLGVGGGGCGCN